MKVVITPNPTRVQDAIPEFQAEFPELEFHWAESMASAIDMVSDADVFVGWITRDIFLAAKKLKWVQQLSTGVDSCMAIPEMVNSDVLLTNVRGAHSVSVAESALAMIFAFTRGVRECIQLHPGRTWAGRDIRARLQELTGSTIGIIGFGSVGRALAKRAAAFDMRILAVDIFPTDKPDSVEGLWALDRFDDLLRASDYIVVTVPYTPDTKNMISTEQFALMKPSALLVHISRGGIVDQQALAAALREGRLAAAAIDVADPEPLPRDSALWEMENLLITYHIAGGTQHEAPIVLDIVRENLGRFVRGDLPLRNQIDMKQGF